MQEVKKDMAQKEKVLSVLIKKKQSRYKKVPGTQFLKMNDPNQSAKIFLGTVNHKKSEYKESIKR